MEPGAFGCVAVAVAVAVREVVVMSCLRVVYGPSEARNSSEVQGVTGAVVAGPSEWGDAYNCSLSH